MDEAKTLLGNKELSISEVCNEVGFESIGSFSTLFKKEIGFARSITVMKLIGVSN